MKYEFHVGDYVETMDGRVGYIQNMGFCDDCRGRGFHEPFVQYANGDADYISAYEYESGFSRYKRIGRYEFTKEDRDKIEPLCEEYTKSFPFYKLDTDRLDMGRIDFGVMSKKINELIKVVNELKEQSNKD